MIKKHVKVKESLSETDKINMINFLFEGYFLVNEEGELVYTPYFREINSRTAFFLYAVEGLTFEEQKDEEGNAIHDESGNIMMESVYDCSVSDAELNQLYHRVFSSRDDTARELKVQLEQVDVHVRDMVEFQKQQMIHGKKDAWSELLSTLTEKIHTLDLNALNLEEPINMIQKLMQREVLPGEEQ